MNYGTLGYVLIVLALCATIGANFLFVRARWKGQQGLLPLARKAAAVATGAVAGSAAYLMYLIGTHHFEISYVAEFSARRSAPAYLYAAFWGGQEGSLLLWAFWTSVLGGILAYRTDDTRVSRAWPIFGVVQVFLLGVILVKCPFALGIGPVPADGKGLNPLLENPWVVVHPPILFLGFASTLIPWVWAVYGLVYRDWDNWPRLAFSWTLFSFAALGCGLSLGGLWAYETLGWGGFWGWDPVECSSLVPWLFLTALLHGIPVQRANGGFKVTNLLIAPLTFATMFYGTFLTRTGLLSDFSVHSFSSLGRDGFILLLIGVVTATFLPLILLAVRLRDIPKPAAYERVWSREFGYFLATAALGVLGLIVAVGMSAPIITKLWVAKGAAAQPEFYNTATYPLAILLTLGMAVTPYLAWRGAGNNQTALRRLWPAYVTALVLAFAATGIAIANQIRQPWILLLLATSLFAIAANAFLILPRLPKPTSRPTLGGFIAHVGAGMLLLGVAVMVLFQQKVEHVRLVRDIPTDVLGSQMTYHGMTTQPYDRVNNAIRITVARPGGESYEADPRYYFAPWENKDTLFANPPDIHRSLLGDTYIAFSGGPEPGPDPAGGVNPNNGFELAAHQSVTAGDYTFTFVALDLDDRAKQTLQQSNGDPSQMAKLPEVTFKAIVGVRYRGADSIAEPEMRLDQTTGGMYSLPVTIPGGWGTSPVMLQFIPPSPEAMNTPQAFDKVDFATMNAPDPLEAVYVDVYTKPLIWLVWLGAALYTAGGLVAYRRRAKDAGLIGAPKAETGEAVTAA